jgi:hypothetical protein
VPILTTEYMDQQAVVDYKQAGGGVAGVLNGAKVIWAIAPFAPSKTLAVGAITQSPDANLAPATVTWGNAVRDALGNIVTISVGLPLQLALNANACTVYGYALTDSGGTHLLLSEVFAAPLVLVDNLTFFEVFVPFAPGNPVSESASVVT